MHYATPEKNEEILEKAVTALVLVHDSGPDLGNILRTDFCEEESVPI